MGIPHDPPDAAAWERWLLPLALAAAEPGGVTGTRGAISAATTLPKTSRSVAASSPSTNSSNGLVVRAPWCRAAHADRNAANTFALVVASASTALPP